MSEFERWVHETYYDQLQLDKVEGGRAFRRFLVPPDARDHEMAGAARVQSFHIIKFGYPMRRAGYEVAVFAVGTGAPETYYAYAYWPAREPGARAAAAGPAGDPPEYVCISPTFESRDGEYRHHFLWYPQFATALEKLSDLAAPLEEGLLGAIASGRVSLDVRIYASAEGTRRIQAFCENTRLGVDALVAALLNGPTRKIGAHLQNHTLPSYVKTITAVFKVVGGVTPTVSSEQLLDLNRLEHGNPHPNFTQCGQKLSPLTLREATHLGDINYAAWREVLVNQWATDLVINGVSPAFPIYNNWTYLVNVDQDLFEGPAMKARFARGLKAAAALESLREARGKLRGAAAADYRMGQLDAHAYDTVKYALDFLVMSQFAMCSTGEYVGLTIRSIPNTIRTRRLISPGYTRFFSEPAMAARYLFDLVYGVHAMHTRIGAIHADLHLNNVTMHPFAQRWALDPGKAPREKHGGIRNPTIAYVAGPKGEADTYVFPHDGWFATIIDFSRALLGPAARERIAAEHGEAYAALFYRNQVSRALRVLHHYVPSFAKKHQESLKGLLLSDPAVMFRVMTAVDFLALGRNFAALFRETAASEGGKGHRNPIAIAPEGPALAARLERVALEHLVARLSDLVSGRARRDPSEYEFVGAVVIPAVFEDFRFAAWARGDASPCRPYPLAEATLVDVYSVEAPLAHSGTDPERFPPWARLDVIEKHLDGRVKMVDVTADRGERPFLRAHTPSALLDVLVEQARHAVEAADHPADATSSWLAD